MNMEFEDYILDHIDKEPEHLHKLDRDTHLRLINPRMCSGHLQGRLLKMLVRMIRPKMMLELGTYSGYSAQCLAEGLLDSDAHLHTIEICDELEDFIQEHLSECPWRDRITLHIGDAKQILPQLATPFDLVLIDANKRDYAAYYELVMPHVRPGGFIVADNTLWGGKVANSQGEKLDAQTEGILRFNDRVARDNRVEKVIVPLRDGLTLIYKKS